MASEKGFIREVFYCGISAEEAALIEPAKRTYNLSALRAISTIFIALLIVAPLLFNIYPIYAGLLEVFACISFIAIESMVKTPEMFFNDALNAICFTVGGVHSNHLSTIAGA